jgi:hypothetical protein
MDPQEVRPMIDAFYEREFPQLRHLTRPRPEAKRLIHFALDHQLEIVVATNPLFPRTAIEARLEWADLATKDIPFRLITSYENSHYAKPNLEYFAEILAKLGRSPHEAAMIGNSLSDDVEPAHLLGLAVFHISEALEGDYPAGDLEAALSWVHGLLDTPVIRKAPHPDGLLARLRGNLTAFIELRQDLIESDWGRRPSPDSWAPVEIMCHLRDVEVELNFPRIRRFLNEDYPFISAVDSDSWAAARDYLEQTPSDAIDAFIEARKATIDLLASISSETWQQDARHAIFGPTHLIEIVNIFIEHELLHIRQLYAALPERIATSV